MSEKIFEHLASELAISYNGYYIKHTIKKKSSLKGVILSDRGQIYARNNRSDQWEHIRTPDVFYFYDNESEVTYLVNVKYKCIQPVVPAGRILDCTDKAIYDIIDNTWCPIYDLSPENTLTMVQCKKLASAENSFEIVGCAQYVLEEISQISADAVDLESGTLETDAVLPGQCKVLIYKTQLCHDYVIVAQIFMRDAEKPRFAATGGKINTNLWNDDQIITTNSADLVDINQNVYVLVDWELTYVIPDEFEAQNQVDFANGEWKVTQSGDYQVSYHINLNADSDGWIGLLQNNQMVAYAPIRNRQAGTNLGLKLIQNDVLRLVYVHALDMQMPETIACATTWNAHYLGVSNK